LELLDDGGVRLSCKEAGEPTWVMAEVPREGMRAVVFEISDYTPGAGVLLRHEDKGLLHVFRVMKNTRTGRLTLAMTGDHHTWQQDLGVLEERMTAEIGDRLWIKLLQGSHMLRCWISADNSH